MRVFGILVISMIVLAGCGGQQGSAPEQREKKPVDEETITIERTVEKTVEKAIEEPESTMMSSAEADAAKAAAAEQEITLEQLRGIDASTAYGKQLVSGLGNCQLVKFRVDVGKQAYQEWFDGYMDELADTPASQVTSIQEEMIMMGYSCSVPEAMAGMPAEE